MDKQQVGSLVLIPWEELNNLKETQLQILIELKKLANKNLQSVPRISTHITAIQFMKEVGICRTKFDKLVAARKIQVIKKKRKIYVPIIEVDRYFKDPSIQ